VTDNDRNTISITLNGKELRAFYYYDESERRMKMLMAREYVEGWCDGSRAVEQLVEVAFEKLISPPTTQ
jgi:hypothetical protein